MQSDQPAQISKPWIKLIKIPKHMFLKLNTETRLEKRSLTSVQSWAKRVAEGNTTMFVEGVRKILGFERVAWEESSSSGEGDEEDYREEGKGEEKAEGKEEGGKKTKEIKERKKCRNMCHIRRKKITLEAWHLRALGYHLI